jgi:hemolysin III
VYDEQMEHNNLVKPLLRGHFHQAMFFVSLGACSLLLLKANTTVEFYSLLIYSIGLLTMFGISAIYHRIHWEPAQRLFMRKLDHAGIYVMIAGTFTPVTLLSLSESSGKTLLITIWVIALVGILQSIFFVNLPKIVSSIIYLIAGYMVFPYLPELSERLSLVQMILILGGGLVYSLGALSYGLKWPNINPKIFGYHEVFHLLVSIAAIMHFALIYSLLNH